MNKIKKRYVQVGLSLVTFGVILITASVISWIDFSRNSFYPSESPRENSVAWILNSLSIFVGQPSLLIGLPITIHGFFPKFSKRIMKITGIVLLVAYGIFWIVMILSYS